MLKKLKDYSIIAVGAIAAAALALLALKYLLPVLLPFIIAWLIATLTRAPAERLASHGRVPASVFRLMLSLLLTALIFGTLTLIIWQITAAAWRFLTSFGEGNRLYDIIVALTSPDFSFLGISLPPELADKISEALGSVLSSAITALADSVRKVAMGVPNILFFLLVTVISLIYLSLDLERVNRFLRSLLPRGAGERFAKIRDGAFSTVKKYILSYALLTAITYAIMLVGFLILGIKNAPLIALIVSLLDILPVIGVGTVLVPWSILELATGNLFLGIGLLVLFIVNTVIRQLAEPKIVGKSLGLHPLATIVTLYAGYSLFGILGLILAPLVSVILNVVLNENKTASVGEGLA